MRNFFIASQFEAEFFLDDFNQIDNNVYEKDYRVIVTGIGLVNTAISCSKFFSEYGINEEDQYINIGIAGAVNSSFEIGQIIEAKSFSVYKSSKIPENSFDIMLEAYPEINFGKTKLASSLAPVWGEDHKKELESSNIDLVDMEAYSFVKACSEFDVEFQVIKAVSDHLLKDSQESFLDNAKIALGSLKKELNL